MLRLITTVVLAANVVTASPALRVRDGSTVMLRHHDGCAAAWRTDASGELLWFFTARLPKPLVASVTADSLTLRTDTGLVVRDDIHQASPPADRKTSRYAVFRLYRPAGPCAFQDEQITSRLLAFKVRKRAEGDRGAVLSAGEWVYIAAGPASSPRLIVRTTHAFLADDDPPRLLAAGEEIYADAAGPEVLDDGNFALARVLPQWAMDEAVTRLRIRRTFGDRREPPKLDAKQWLQTNGPLMVSNFKNKAVVMLNFWGVWCKPCVAELPKLTELRQRIPSPDFVVIGVHSAEASDRLPAFLEKHVYPAPIAIDAGETAKAYGIEVWPTYILIDKSGRVVHFGSALPSADAITSLLR